MTLLGLSIMEFVLLGEDFFMARAFVFPGQGSQVVGMGKLLFDKFDTARHVFEEVDDSLKQNLSKIIFDGPEDELRLTENTQPALMAVSVSLMRVLTEKFNLDLSKHVRFVAGHSLGEYSALCAAGTLSVHETARLLKLRGRAMQEAVPYGQGAMAALVGLDVETAKIVSEKASIGGVCDLANDNAPGQVVVSGNAESVSKAVEIAKEYGARRPVLLPVSAPFHCSLMEPAAKVMLGALKQVKMVRPVVPLIPNVVCTPVDSCEVISELLVRQITAMVRWRESILYMKHQGVDTFVEVGAGKVLTNILKRNDKELTGISIAGPNDLESYMQAV